MKKYSVFILFFVLMNFKANSQLVWNKSYGTTDFDYPRQIIRLSTGEFLFCGDNNGPAGYLAKIDSKGDSLWTKRIFPNDTDKTVTTITLYQINSNTFLVGGAGSKSLAPNTSYGCLWKFDLNGNILWRRQTSKVITNIIDYRNGHVIYTDFSNLSKMDTLGNVIWNVSFGQYIKPANVLKTKSNTYCFLYLDSLKKFHFKEISEHGNTLRDSALTFLNSSTVYGLFIQDSSGNFLVATDEGGVVVRKFNNNLESTWKKSYSTQLDLNAMIQATNGDYVIVGESRVTGDAQMSFIRLSENGDYKAVRIFGPLQKDDIPRDVCADSDAGIVILGYYEDGPIGSFDYLLVKSNEGIAAGIQDEEGSSTIHIYPNPTDNMATISFERNFSGRVQVNDVLGRSVLIEEINNAMTYAIQLQNQPKGMYIVTLTDDKKLIKTSKIILF